MTWLARIGDHPLLMVGERDLFARRAFGQVYLATPYTKRAAPEGRFVLALADAAAGDAVAVLDYLAECGVTAVSPIVLAHAMVRARMLSTCDRPMPRGQVGAWALDAVYWQGWCRQMLDASRMVFVPAIDGRLQSIGIEAEVIAALAANKPVFVERGDA